MKTHALAAFRQDPLRLNCAQSVLHAYQEVTGDRALDLASLKTCGAGRAPEGRCGALHAACLIVPQHAAAIQARFAAALGSDHCRDLREADQHPCTDCVRTACELVAALRTGPCTA